MRLKGMAKPVRLVEVEPEHPLPPLPQVQGKRRGLDHPVVVMVAAIALVAAVASVAGVIFSRSSSSPPRTNRVTRMPINFAYDVTASQGRFSITIQDTNEPGAREGVGMRGGPMSAREETDSPGTICEGTNQIQRVVIAREMLKKLGRRSTASTPVSARPARSRPSTRPSASRG